MKTAFLPHAVRTRRPAPAWTALLGAIGAMAAGACQAQTSWPPRETPDAPAAAAPLARLGAAASAAAIQSPGPSLAFAAPQGAPAAGMSGFARTALDHRFSPDHVTGSVGYLCGLHAASDEASGPAASSDPVGTFLGAKLSYAF